MSEPGTFRGLGVSPGLAIGRVHLVDRRRVKVPRYHVGEDARDVEWRRFERAVAIAIEQLTELQARAREDGLSQVGMLIAAHEMILRDHDLLTPTRRRIEEEGQNAEWALKTTLRDLKRMFDRLEQDFFRERRSDVDVVGDRLLRILTGDRSDPLDGMPEGAVVLAHDLSPADTVSLAKKKALGFVTETGGRTSHTAIMARALNVPSVLGVPGILEVAGSGDLVIVDGRTGEVVLQPQDAVVGRYRSMQLRRREEARALLADRDLVSQTADGVRIELLGNVEVSDETDIVVSHGGEGVGLYRTEFMRLERADLRGHLDHYDVYRGMVQRLKGGPLTVRTLDVGGDKAELGERPSPERSPSRSGSVAATPAPSPPPEGPPNPALGLRAIRLSLRDRGPFREQLKGIALASAEGPVRLLVPFVTTVEEVRAVRAELESVQEDLAAEGRPFDPHMPLGIMIETPGAAVMADVFARECDFFAVGTNDLIQYTLATDRSDDEVAYLFRPAHPALIRLIHQVVEAARTYATPVSVCGEVAADPFFTPLLLGLGVRALSMNPTSIPVVKRMVRRLDAGACAAFAVEARGMATADEVERALADRLKVWTPDLLGA